jgi:superfamily I DNA/RNA helicase
MRSKYLKSIIVASVLHHMVEADEQLQEAKRLFYVGITRAKNQIYFLYNREESRFATGIRDAA